MLDGSLPLGQMMEQDIQRRIHHVLNILAYGQGESKDVLESIMEVTVEKDDDMSYLLRCMFDYMLELSPPGRVSSFADVFITLESHYWRFNWRAELVNNVQDAWHALLRKLTVKHGNVGLARQENFLIGFMGEMFWRSEIKCEHLTGILGDILEALRSESCECNDLLQWFCNLLFRLLGSFEGRQRALACQSFDEVAVLFRGAGLSEHPHISSQVQQSIQHILNLKDGRWQGVEVQLRNAIAEDGTLMICWKMSQGNDGTPIPGRLFGRAGVGDDDLKRHLSEHMMLKACFLILVKDPRAEILSLFDERKLPVAAAEQLTDPQGEYDFEDLPTLAEFVKEKDLRAVGLKVAPARKLLRDLRPHGEIHTQLVLARRLPPEMGNPNDGSECSDQTGSSGNTTVQVPRSIKERIPPVAKQLHAHESLARKGAFGENLREVSSKAFREGIVDCKEHERLLAINEEGNAAKHANFGGSTSRPYRSWE